MKLTTLLDRVRYAIHVLRGLPLAYNMYIGFTGELVIGPKDALVVGNRFQRFEDGEEMDKYVQDHPDFSRVIYQPDL